MILWPIAYALNVLGFSGLAIAMPRHASAIGKLPRIPRSALRTVAAILLSGALMTCVASWGAARGIPIAIGLASVAAITVGLLLSLVPGRLIVIAGTLLVLAGLISPWG